VRNPIADATTPTQRLTIDTRGGRAPISITDHPDRLVVDTDGQAYRIQFRSEHDKPPIGRLVGGADSNPEAEPTPLTAPDVAQPDVDTEIARWDELTRTEVHRRLANAGLRVPALGGCARSRRRARLRRGWPPGGGHRP
jgi:hypothetical protein